MAILKQGAQGNWRKKAGNYSYRRWRNLNVAAILPESVSNPRTTKQVGVRARLARLSEIGRACRNAVNLGLKNICDGTKVFPRAKFIGINWAASTIELGGDVTVDYPMLKFAQGNCPECRFSQADFTRPQNVEVNWDSNITEPGARNNDAVAILLFNVENNQVILNTTAQRGDGTQNLEVPVYWNGMKVHVFAWAIGAEGGEYPGIPSDSVYIGQGNIG